MAIDFEGACFRAKNAAWELDEASRPHNAYFDPERLNIARQEARSAFDALTIATREEIVAKGERS